MWTVCKSKMTFMLISSVVKAELDTTKLIEKNFNWWVVVFKLILSEHVCKNFINF